GEQRLNLRLESAVSRARGGDYQPAAALADDLGRRAALPGAALRELARIHALLAGSARRDAARPLAERDKRSQEHARHAVPLLGAAAAAGFFRHRANANLLDSDHDLAVLRDRDDYRRFRAGLSKHP